MEARSPMLLGTGREEAVGGRAEGEEVRGGEVG